MSRWGFAVGLVVYLAAALAASATPGPRAWGIHLLGFLPPWGSTIVLCLLGAAIAASAVAAMERAPESSATVEPPESPALWEPSARVQVAFLTAYAGVLWLLRTRTRFLGDGMFWEARLRTGHIPAPPEPLSQVVWEGASAVLRQIAAPVASLALVSIACGVVAAMFSWRIAREIGRTNAERAAAFLLLLTLGSSQLFFGYVESYPVGMTLFLAYLAAGLRAARERGSLILLAVAYVAAFASHLIALYLAPSFLFLVARAEKPLAYKVSLLALTAGVATGAIVLLGSTPSTWIHTFDVATRTARTGSLINEFSKPYGFLSLDHAIDMMNELLLVIPIPLLLLVAAGFEFLRQRAPIPFEITFLILAAVPGLVGLCLLVLPVAPAQDWDLNSMLLVPLGVLGVRLGRSLYGGGATMTRAAVAAAGLGCLLSFVLVNANEQAALRRYETLVGPGAKLSSFGRWYAWECLAQYYRHEHDYDHAMEYVRRLIESSGSNPRYWGMAGETLNGFGRYAEAVPFLLESLRRNPDRPAARTNLGIAYSHLGRYDEAMEQFREAVRMVDDNPDYHHNLGLAYWNVGARDSAHAEWTSLLARWPGYTRTERALQLYFGEPPGRRP